MKARTLIICLLYLAACAPLPQVEVSGYVNLEDLQPLQPSTAEVRPLRVAVAAVISPKGTVESYTALLDYLGQRLNRPVQLIQRRTYLEINDLIANGDADLAFVCTSAYIVGSEQFGMELLVAPQVEGETVYYSYLIVPADSPAESMEDLRGKVFAFTDPISLSGRVYPTYLVQQLGETPETFFGRYFFTYSHDQAIYAVAHDLADGAAVDSLVYDYMLARDPSLAERTRIIHRSPPFGIPPVVVGPSADPQLRSDLRTLFLNMHQSPEGRLALEAIGVDRFVVIPDSAYDDARLLVEQVNLPIP